MPKRNPAGDVYAERYLAQRIGRERERRGWSYEGLASRMTAAGCPLNQSAIYKIERGDPPRRITVDELVGYSRVFGLSVESLLLDPDIEAEARVVELLGDWRRVHAERLETLRRCDEQIASLETQIRELTKRSPQADAVMQGYFAELYPDSHWADDLPDLIREGGR